LYCPVKIIYKNKTLFDKKLVFIGKVPLMTENGSFIINGNPRTIGLNKLIL
jgi:DNA-directed RNA polymerase beta subunit